MGKQYDLTIELNFTVDFGSMDDDDETLPPAIPYLGPRVTSKARIKARDEAAEKVAEELTEAIEGIEWDELAGTLGANRAWCASVEVPKSWGPI